MITIPVRYPASIAKRMEELKAKTGGYYPFMCTVESIKDIRSCLNVPTLYPELTVPKSLDDGGWEEVELHINHLSRALDGIPELCAQGDELDTKIAASLNSELELLAAECEGVARSTTHEGTILSQVEDYTKKDHTETLGSGHVFFAFRLQTLVRLSAPQSKEGLDLFAKTFPKEVEKASEIQRRIGTVANINTLLGKIEAANIFIDELNLDRGKFYFNESKFQHGINTIHSLDYYEMMDAHERTAFHEITKPFATIDIQFPFNIPTLQGCYKFDNGIILLKTTNVTNERATWKTEGATRNESLMDSNGLYQNSVLKIFIPGTYKSSMDNPPDDILYKNYKTYPEVIQKAVSLANRMVEYVRQTNKRCDIPDASPSHFNHVHFQQYDTNGDVIHSVHTSFETSRMSFGPPKIDDEVLSRTVTVDRLPFYSQLLSSAKFFLLQRNTRRAVLDYCGAVEAFIDKSIVVKLTKPEETVKELFLRLYNDELINLPKECRDSIDGLFEQKDGGKPLPVGKIIREYRKEKHTPKITNSQASMILGPFKERNSASHGREIDDSVFGKLEKAIDMFERIDKTFAKYCS